MGGTFTLQSVVVTVTSDTEWDSGCVHAAGWVLNQSCTQGRTKGSDFFPIYFQKQRTFKRERQYFSSTPWLICYPWVFKGTQPSTSFSPYSADLLRGVGCKHGYTSIIPYANRAYKKVAQVTLPLVCHPGVKWHNHCAYSTWLPSEPGKEVGSCQVWVWLEFIFAFTYVCKCEFVFAFMYICKCEFIFASVYLCKYVLRFAYVHLRICLFLILKSE
jgi:hypothetical protein